MSSTPKYTDRGIAHFDIAGPDGPALAGFYQDVLGWQVEPRGPGYSQVQTPEGSPNGAVAEAETASLTLGVTVADLDAVLTRVEAAGGSITMPKVDNGYVTKAQIADAAGNRLTLIQM